MHYLMNTLVYPMDIRSVPIGHISYLMNTPVYLMDIRSVPIGHISLPNEYTSVPYGHT